MDDLVLKSVEFISGEKKHQPRDCIHNTRADRICRWIRTHPSIIGLIYFYHYYHWGHYCYLLHGFIASLHRTPLYSVQLNVPAPPTKMPESAHTRQPRCTLNYQSVRLVKMASRFQSGSTGRPSQWIYKQRPLTRRCDPCPHWFHTKEEVPFTRLHPLQLWHLIDQDADKCGDEIPWRSCKADR